MINRSDLISLIATNINASKSDVKVFYDALEDIVSSYYPTNDIRLFNGITLTRKQMKESVRRNPRTGEQVNVEERILPKVKFSVKYKQIFKDSATIDE